MSDIAKSNRMSADQENVEFMTVAELAAYLRIGRSAAYELCHWRGFPAIRVGRSIRIHKTALAEWLYTRARGGIDAP
ncbi:MAG TPA: helix-turn-helix domain-containing protein [Bacillota bacterium]|jgi:excisionase family DNA binding protein|nr:helix-turn-helix domain-containing protein [Bacillota bacterium]